MAEWNARVHQPRGGGGGRRGPVNEWMPAHDPRHRALPRFAVRIGDPGDPTALLRDARDGRLISPFQHEHPFAVETNAEAGVNRITEPNQVLQPNAGTYFLLYHVVTTNTHKLNLVVSFDIPEGHSVWPLG